MHFHNDSYLRDSAAQPNVDAARGQHVTSRSRQRIIARVKQLADETE